MKLRHLLFNSSLLVASASALVAQPGNQDSRELEVREPLVDPFEIPFTGEPTETDLAIFDDDRKNDTLADTVTNTDLKDRNFCEWDDGFGPVPCDVFSILFNVPQRSTEMGKTVVNILGVNRKDAGRPVWHRRTSLRCNNVQAWTFIQTPLPYLLEIHAGNACSRDRFSAAAAWDNTWIRYGGGRQWLDVPTSPRCRYPQALTMRCLVPMMNSRFI